jgi:AmmeMemoRadiSam system protein A
MHLNETQRGQLLDLARHTIRQALNALSIQSKLDIDRHDPAFQSHAGCFVSLHELTSDRLRGCVGCLQSNHPLIETVERTSRDVLEDPRFVSEPVHAFELTSLSIELTLLSPLRQTLSVLDFEPLSEGIALELDGRVGCFLPQVAHNTGWSREQLLAHLCMEKLSLPHNAWQRPDAMLKKFNTEIIGPEPFDPGASRKPSS